MLRKIFFELASEIILSDKEAPSDSGKRSIMKVGKGMHTSDFYASVMSYDCALDIRVISTLGRSACVLYRPKTSKLPCFFFCYFPQSA